MRTFAKRFCVQKVKRAAVFFDDLLYDGQAKAGALIAGRHVWFEQFGSIGWKADPVIGDINLNEVGHRRQSDAQCRNMSLRRA